MARVKLQINRIQNSIKLQVKFSKRRKDLFKKADELTGLWDAKVSIIMSSSSGKLSYVYISPSTTMKQHFDQYQKTLGVDIWKAHYERMQDHLEKLEDVTRNLRTQIRQRMGDCLDDLSLADLRGLEQEMSNSVMIIREQKDC